MSQWIARKGCQFAASCCKGERKGGRVWRVFLIVTVSALESLGWGVLKFIFVLCIYLSQGVFHFALGKSSYNLMLKKFFKELLHTNQIFFFFKEKEFCFFSVAYCSKVS